jgi:hypothetical protein
MCRICSQYEKISSCDSLSHLFQSHDKPSSSGVTCDNEAKLSTATHRKRYKYKTYCHVVQINKINVYVLVKNIYILQIYNYIYMYHFTRIILKIPSFPICGKKYNHIQPLLIMELKLRLQSQCWEETYSGHTKKMLCFR